MHVRLLSGLTLVGIPIGGSSPMPSDMGHLGKGLDRNGRLVAPVVEIDVGGGMRYEIDSYF